MRLDSHTNKIPLYKPQGSIGCFDGPYKKSCTHTRPNLHNMQAYDAQTCTYSIQTPANISQVLYELSLIERYCLYCSYF